MFKQTPADSNFLEYTITLKWFTQVMKGKLAANTHKGTWRGDTREALLERIKEELDEYQSASGKAAKVMELADVANMCMMLADVERNYVEDKATPS